jgi:hypothetical protein
METSQRNNAINTAPPIPISTSEKQTQAAKLIANLRKQLRSAGKTRIQEVEFTIINIRKFLSTIKEFEIAINKPSLIMTDFAIQQIFLNTQDIKKAVENRSAIGLSPI